MNIHSIVRDAWITAIIYSFLPQIIHEDISINGVLLAIAFGLGYAIGFAVNNYYDAEIDRTNSDKIKNNYFIENSMSRKTAFGLLFASFLYFLFVAIRFGFLGLISLSLLSFIVWSYSAEPIKFKRRVGFDIVVHAFFVQTTPYFFTLLLLDFPPNSFDYLFMTMLFLISASGQIAGQLRDFDLDLQTHQTFAIKLGKKNTKIVYYFNIILIVFVGLYGIIIDIMPVLMAPLLFIGSLFIIARSTNSLKKSKIMRYFDPTLGMIALLYISIVIIYASTSPDKINPLLNPI